MKSPATETPTGARKPGQAGTTRAAGRYAWLRDPWIWLLLGVGLALAFFSTTHSATGLNRDEGAFLAIADQVLHGHVPYRDVFDQKSPAIYYLLAAVLAITSPLTALQRVLVLRGVVVVVNLLTAAGLVALGKRWWRLEVGVLAGLLWLYCLQAYGGAQFFTEPFAACATVWAVVVAVRWPGNRGALGAGLLLALGALFKQTTVLALPGLTYLLLADAAAAATWWRPARAGLARLGALALGFCLPWLLVCAAFAAVGGLGAFVDQVLVSNVAHYPADPAAAVLAGNLSAFATYWIFWALAGVVIVAGLVRWLVPLGPLGGARHAPGVGAVTCVLIAAFNLVPMKSHAYFHYYLQVLPWAALLVGISFLALLAVWQRLVPRLNPQADVAKLLPSQALLAGVLLIVLVGAAAGQLVPTDQWRYDIVQLRGQAAVGAWIASYAPPTARLLVAPAEPEDYYFADRSPAAPYVYILPINLSPALLAHLSDQISAHQYDVIAWQTSGGGNGREPYFAAVERTLTAHYHAIATDAYLPLSIYVPNGTSAAPTS